MDAVRAADGGRPELRSSVALALWLALVLTLLRLAVVSGLELAHHGEVALARLRASGAFASTALAAVVVAALGAAGAALLVRATRAPSAARVSAFWLALGALCYLHLGGSLDGDASRRVGSDTGRGLAALVACAAVSVALASIFLVAVRRRLSARSWIGALLPLALFSLCAWTLRASDGLSPTLVAHRIEQDLCEGGWEILSGRIDRPPGPGVLAPSVDASRDGAARPAWVMPPPARVRTVVPDDAGSLHLVAGVGIDHSVAEDAGERYAGGSVRFRVRRDGREMFTITLPVDDAQSWTEICGEQGCLVAGGATIELETTYLDPAGNEAVPDDPLAVGFGELTLDRRTVVARAEASPERPSIVLVLLDTLRADRTTPYGCERDTTPNLAALASRGVVFEQALSTSSWTWPSTASVLSGLQPAEHGVEDAESSFLSDRVDTLAEALQRAGFTTAAWSGSPLIVPEKNFDQGFEFFDASVEGTLRPTEQFLPAALEWLGAVGERRFFLYLHLMDPHAPPEPLPEARERFASEVPATFAPRKVLDYTWDLRRSGFTADGQRATESVVSPEEQRWIRDLYDAQVWTADARVGALLARLEELDLTDRTIVAVTSDHGEELFEHGLLSHAHTLHRELVHVPLVIAGPGVPAGKRIPTLLSNAALAPTLARLGGAKLEGQGEPCDLLDGSALPDEVLFSTRQGWWNGQQNLPLYGIQSGTSVLHYSPDARAWGARAPTPGGEVRLYELGVDPGELEDLAVSDPERAQELREELRARFAELEQRVLQRGGFADPATMEMLRGLGYVGEEKEEPER